MLDLHTQYSFYSPRWMEKIVLFLHFLQLKERSYLLIDLNM